MRGRVNIGSGLKINDAIDSIFEVDSGQSILVGDPITIINDKINKSSNKIIDGLKVEMPLIYDTASTSDQSVCKLDDTHILIAYKNSNGYGTAIVLTVLGDKVIAGSPFIFNSANSQYISMGLLSAGKVLITYRNGGNNNYGTAIVLTISGTTITAGTPVIFKQNSIDYNDICIMDETHATVVYRDYAATYRGSSVILTISGTTITVGTQAYFASGQVNGVSVCTLDATHALIGYLDAANYCVGVIQVSSGGSITTFGGTVTIFAAVCAQPNIAKIDASNGVMTFYENTNGDSCFITFKISASTIYEVHSRTIIRPSLATLQRLIMLDATHFLLFYMDNVNSSFGTLALVTISGTTGFVNYYRVYTTGGIGGLDACLVDNKILVSYCDNANSNYGTSRVLTGYKLVDGIATQSGVAGQNIKCKDWR